MNKYTLSIILITKNESDRVEACLKSIAGIADEIIVLDSGSTDETIDICKRYTDNVISTDWPGFGKQKQRALDKATCDWVLSIDADEALDEQMQQSIKHLLAQDSITETAFRLALGATLYGKTLKYGRTARLALRLFVRKNAYFTPDEVHETVVPKPGKTGVLKGYLLHYSHRDFGHGLEKAANYAWLGSQKYQRKGKKSSGLFMAFLSSFWAFFHTYFVRRGFLDGGIGFIMAMTYAQINFNKYAGLWVLKKNEKRGKSL